MLPFPSAKWAYKPPPQFTVLNRAHPLARSLTDMWMFNEGGSISQNLVRPAYPMVGSTSTSIVGHIEPSSQGLAGRVSANSSVSDATWHVANSDVLNYVAGDFAIRVVFQPTNWNGDSFATLLSKNGSSDRELGVFISSAGNISFMDVGDSSASVGGGNVFPQGFVGDFCMSRTGGFLSVYANGNLVFGTTANGTAGGFGSARYLYLNNDQHGGGAGFDGKYLLMQIWNRGLSQAEVTALYLDRYGVLMPPNTWWAGITSSTPPVLDAQDWFGSTFYIQKTQSNVAY